MTGMRNRWILTGLLAGIAVLSLGASRADEAERARPAALAAFTTVQKVLQHPRCQNCHIPGDAPLQFDAGLPHVQT